MAKLEMKRIEIVTLLADSKAAVDFLQRSGVVELEQSQPGEGLESLDTAALTAHYKELLQRVRAAKSLIDKLAPKGGLLDFLNGTRELSEEEYALKAEQVEHIANRCRRLAERYRAAQERRASIAAVQAKADALQPWLGLDIPLQCRETEHSRVFVGTLPFAVEGVDYGAGGVLTREGERLQTECAALEVVSSSPRLSCVTAICHKSDAAELEQALRRIGFVRPARECNKTPWQMLEEYEGKIGALEAELGELEEKLKSCGELREDCEFLVDWLDTRVEKYLALEKLPVSRSCLMLRGFVPEDYAQRLANELEGRFAAAVRISEPEEGEEVPTFLKNNGFVAPMESITNMYSPPSVGDVDPNPVMSVFYYIFFGLMLSDAGYGLLMVLAMLFVKLKFKLSPAMKNSTTMFLCCGVSTVFWGAMFGSWFGDIVQVVGLNFFGVTVGPLYLWLDTIGQSLTLMLFCFAFGIIHLLAGYAVRFYNQWKHGKRLDAVCDNLFVSLLMVGIAPIGAGLIIPVPELIGEIGKYLMLAGVGGILLTGGRASKGIVGKLGGGLYGIYNAAAGILGDVLSYSRLLALGLTTGVIASVVNMLGVMPQNPVVKAVALVLVFVVGHGVNMAINLIGAYVHTNRLQYVEFFSKFYEGGGKLFTPFAIKSTYVTIKKQEAKHG
jgi:V/A-type H+-transporting ATPase subunit I